MEIKTDIINANDIVLCNQPVSRDLRQLIFQPAERALEISSQTATQKTCLPFPVGFPTGISLTLERKTA